MIVAITALGILGAIVATCAICLRTRLNPYVGDRDAIKAGLSRVPALEDSLARLHEKFDALQSAVVDYSDRKAREADTQVSALRLELAEIRGAHGQRLVYLERGFTELVMLRAPHGQA